MKYQFTGNSSFSVTIARMIVGFAAMVFFVSSSHGASRKPLATLSTKAKQPSSKTTSKATVESDKRQAQLDFALYSAIGEKKYERVKQLLKQGANPNTKQNSDGGIYPLHRAVFENDVQILNLLLAHHANPNVKADDGQTVN